MGMVACNELWPSERENNSPVGTFSVQSVPRWWSLLPFRYSAARAPARGDQEAAPELRATGLDFVDER